MQGFVYDVEANGFLFEADKVWTICFKDIETGKEYKVNPFKDDKAKQKFLKVLDRYDYPFVVGHNILGYDQAILKCIMGIGFQVGKKDGDTIAGRKVKFLDTCYLSQFLNPDRLGGHSIAALGKTLGLPKIDWRAKAVELGLIHKDDPDGAEFMQWHPEMDVYCQRDVNVNYKVLFMLLKEYENLYGEVEDKFSNAYICGQKQFYLMANQEYSGFKFDSEFAEELKPRIEEMMEEIREEVEPKLPTRGLKKSEEPQFTMPAKPYKKDGTFSANWYKFVEKHNGKDLGDGEWEFYGEKYKPLAGGILDYRPPMEMADQKQMKEWFLENGWKPTMWNFKKGPDGKNIRDPQTKQLTKTSPKLQEAGKICPNIEAMEGEIVQKVVKWMSLRNRLSILEGWMKNERLGYDGRIGAGRSGIANTHRQRHAVVVNVPKASEKVTLGKEFRSLWVAEKGKKIAAGDASGLEGRVQAHYTWKYDGGKTAKELLSGDPHSKVAKSVFKEQLTEFDIDSPEFSKDDPIFKPFRDRSKNIFYACLYGAGAKKLASVAGLPESEGGVILERFWDANLGTKWLKDAVENYWETIGNKKYMLAIDGRFILTRSKSALLNTLFQSCGGIIMDYACCFLDMWLGDVFWDEKRRPYYSYKGHIVRRVAYMHDEVEFECEEPVAEEVAKLIERAISKAGKFLSLHVPLEGEGMVGDNWKDCH